LSNKRENKKGWDLIFIFIQEKQLLTTVLRGNKITNNKTKCLITLQWFLSGHGFIFVSLAWRFAHTAVCSLDGTQVGLQLDLQVWRMHDICIFRTSSRRQMADF
jgi:hypothetical protein